MTHLRWTTSLALVAVLATGTNAFAQGPGRRGGGPGAGAFSGPLGGGRGLGLGAADVDLSDAQRQQIRSILGQARESNRPLADRLRDAQRALRTATMAAPVDENQIRAASAALAGVQADLAVARARAQSDVMAVLTPDQQAKVTEARQRRMQRLEQRRERVEQRRQRPNGNR
jgi:periplasmic protein CpxP/Spy